MSLAPVGRVDKYCLVACPPEQCDCIAGAPNPYLDRRMCSTCRAALEHGGCATCSCYIPERDSPSC